MVAFRGHFDGKVIVPDEPVDIPQDQQFVVTLAPAAPKQQHPQGVGGQRQDDVGEDPKPGESFLAWAARNPLPADAGLPTDLSENLDHYLYGSPKRTRE